ncbi:bifunctional 5,10-methylenetetrahydrofolate dehydrogenase/5,10-methenyltetrahydrofolate cyclohydrolase [Phaeocystidibacter marisrubri]|uniref:Bifunctional protein FolD n=1 Tax=Phaeocystidibacter marisrubri TaxID=1577780 RepID=A0A6L3ZJM2_9FLAO|nr:bifunctional 5,10-methylenetetrahydrofolate dehydrogenase/5,10-methenyltetrahydrofolate cyclohydrolase [Phaeocystidibacter marisrubri]KAB2817853.1 bifunctional 5,10-methylenetetrahydrofolate dehydrogenase/5,10-methenyltetrahydrofolate cyclohydrolase [Phaeocystidibacter marisrubri]GGH73201.1 bifunctional protein FolD [Phaeocystidibacter marisrubri]
MTLLDGKVTARAYKEKIALEVQEWVARGNRPPHLAAVLVGDNPASVAYVNGKVKDCEQVGMKSSLIKLPSDISQEDLLAKVAELNADEGLDGFIVQLPLPNHIDEKTVTLAIDPKKDVDGFHPENVGRMALNLPTYLPATPHGILMMLEHYNIETIGKHCVVVGRSNIVGSPMSILMARNANPGNATVTLTHSRTVDLKTECLRADILIAAIGKANFITADMVKPGAVVIDVGINRVDDASRERGYRLTGDVDFDGVSAVASHLTPVPGGVGLMTRVALLQNTLQAARGEN